MEKARLRNMPTLHNCQLSRQNSLECFDLRAVESTFGVLGPVLKYIYTVEIIVLCYKDVGQVLPWLVLKVTRWPNIIVKFYKVLCQRKTENW